MFLFEEKLTVDLCSSNPKAIVVFGDNLICKGKAGQAIIRDEPNAYGIPTKRLPAMTDEAFFSDLDSEYNAVKTKLIDLWLKHENGYTIILPINQIGSGLANLKAKSPKINTLIERFYNKAREQNK